MNRFAFVALTLILIHGCATLVDAPPDDDAGSTPDAAVADDAAVSDPDAWSMPSCPGYAAEVQPIFARHCATCHTTGRDARFGSNVTVARQTTSGCGPGYSMVACVMAVGRPGGQMAVNDPYGGFSPTDLATIQSWSECGMPD